MTEDASKAEDVFGRPSETVGATRTEKRTLTVGKMYKEGGIVKSEEVDEDTIEVHIPHGGIPMADVGFGCRMTVNMGNFESVQLAVDIKLPCYLEELDDCFRAAKTIVDAKLNKEVSVLKEYRAEKKD